MKLNDYYCINNEEKPLDHLVDDSKSAILQMGEVLIYESNRYCEKN